MEGLSGINFVEKIISPRVLNSTDVMIGMGFVGSNGEITKGFGLDFLLFLYMAKQAGEKLESKKRTIFIVDKPFGREELVSNDKIELVRKMLDFLRMDWSIVRFSDTALVELEFSSYEDFQAKIILETLSKGGFQIGWLYPHNNLLAKDELYFANYIMKTHNPENIGFVLGKFPAIIPRYTPGPPYIIKTPQNRVLLVEKEAVLYNKFLLNGGSLAKIKNGKAKELFDFFESVVFEKNNEPNNVLRFIEYMMKLKKSLGNDYKKAFE